MADRFLVSTSCFVLPRSMMIAVLLLLPLVAPIPLLAEAPSTPELLPVQIEDDEPAKGKPPALPVPPPAVATEVEKVPLEPVASVDGEPAPKNTSADLLKRIEQLESKLSVTKETKTDDKTPKKSDPGKSGKAAKDAKDEAPKATPEFPSVKITGFTQLDSAWYDQSPNNRYTVGDAQDGTGFRRARLAVFGKVAEFTSYQLEVDFATAGRPSFFDVYIEQTNLPLVGTVRVGQYCQPFSIDAVSGFRNLIFLERSLPFLAMVPFRRVGLQANNCTEDQMTQWAYSVYRTGGFMNAPLGDDRFATDFGDIGGYGFSTRATQLLYYDEPAADRYLFHVGASYNFSMLAGNDAIGSGTPGNSGGGKPYYQARTTPEFGPLGYPELPQTFGTSVNGTPLFVDTGRYQADYFNLFGVEALYQWGAFSFQSEYMATIVQSVVGPVFYQGAYAQAAYRLTGENRQYDKRVGALTKVIPFRDFISLKRKGICGWGAWEIATRLSFVDLTNPATLDGHYYNTASNTFTGTANAGNGVLTDYTLGLTWFWNQHTKFQFNWIHAFLDNSFKGYSNADLLVTRAQIDF
ncbi:hypothetical protein K2Y11_13070 [bacterium]|nr:hypothetical protein [bacterium]